MTHPIPLPTLGDPGASKRRRVVLAIAGTLAFVAAAVAVPLALAGAGDSDQAGGRAARRRPGAEHPAAAKSAEPPAPTARSPAATPAPEAAPRSAEVAPQEAQAAAEIERDLPGLEVKRGTVDRAGTLSGVLKRHGLGAAESHELAQALLGKFDVRRVRPEHSYVLRFDPATKKLHALSYRVSAAEIYDVTRDGRGALHGARRRVPVQRIHVAKGARVQSSLFEAATRAGLRSVIVGTIAEILSNEVDFYTRQRPGDTLRVVVDEERVQGSFQRYGPIKALEYRGEKAGQARVYRFAAGDQEGYFTSSGRSVEREFLRSPLKFVRVTSEFNPRRMHPVLHRVMGHMGVDLAAPPGTPVYASSAGTIIARGDGGPAGNMVQIQHADGLVTIYAHLSRFEPGQSVGTRVDQRQVIGYVGSTGRATGPHLHYGMKKNGRFIDPEGFEVRPGRPVPRAQMDEFRRLVGRLDGELDSITIE
ncbi:MAG: M23 family metallopeptidase [Deltaproteobacteria bacterium]|nr:M23 family metallopeptidase [Deltaproteobacteria bacterium]